MWRPEFSKSFCKTPFITHLAAKSASMLTKKFMRHRISPLGTPLAEGNWRLITSLLLDKGKLFARLGRKATGQVIPDSRVTEGRIPKF